MSEGSRQDIASRIKELREILDITPESAASRCELPLEEYLKYESGGVDVPISALYAIAGAFGVDLTDLMTGRSPNLKNYCVVRNGRGPEIERYPGYRFQSLAFGFKGRRFEPLLVTLDPEKNEDIALVTHDGQEFNMVMSGRVRVLFGGRSVELSEGDSVFFDPAQPHGQLALDGRQAVFLTVIMHDTEKGQ